MEFLKNRQNLICNIASQTKLRLDASLPAVLSDTQLSDSVRRVQRDLESKRKKLGKKLAQLLTNPASDRVYKVLDDVFRSDSDHVLTRDMDVKNKIKRLARRRFMLGYPPRKAKDTSMGDAFNWEWIVYCATQLKGRIIIVSRDSDFGCVYNNKAHLNDQLKREFRERVGNKSVKYVHRLSDALKELEVPVTKIEEESEKRVISRSRAQNTYADLLTEYGIRKPKNIGGTIVTSPFEVEFAKSLLQNALVTSISSRDFDWLDLDDED